MNVRIIAAVFAAVPEPAAAACAALNMPGTALKKARREARRDAPEAHPARSPALLGYKSAVRAPGLRENVLRTGGDGYARA